MIKVLEKKIAAVIEDGSIGSIGQLHTSRQTSNPIAIVDGSLDLDLPGENLRHTWH
jgi:hypothetical protein